jgi:aminomethyltransferase
MKLISPFYEKHLEHKGKFRSDDGWQLPTVYTSPEEEYRMVRERAGFTDYGFQRQVAVAGKDAFTLLQKVLVNDLRRISPGKAIYSSMLDESGKMMDDSIFFWVEEELFIINTLRKPSTIDWLKSHSRGMGLSIVEMDMFFLSFQGPKTRDVLQKGMNVKDLPYYSLKQDNFADIPALVARVGFTGELGYELYIHPEYGHALWDALVDLGKEFNVGPYGLDSGHILSVEKGYLVPRDFYEGSTPLEVGLGWTVGWDKDFIGKSELQKRRSEGLKTRLFGFEVSDPEVVSAGNDNLLKDSKEVGKVTTAGTYSPTLGKSIGWGWVEARYARTGEELEIEHEGKRVKITMAPKQWYDPQGKKVRG